MFPEEFLQRRLRVGVFNQLSEFFCGFWSDRIKSAYPLESKRGENVIRIVDSPVKLLIVFHLSLPQPGLILRRSCPCRHLHFRRRCRLVGGRTRESSSAGSCAPADDRLRFGAFEITHSYDFGQCCDQSLRVTNVPQPADAVTSPRRFNSATAFATVDGATPNSTDSGTAPGKRDPGGYVPSAIRCSSAAATRLQGGCATSMRVMLTCCAECRICTNLGSRTIRE